MRHETVRDVRDFAEQNSPKLVETKPSQASTSLSPALRIMSDGREDLQTSLRIARARSSRLKTVLDAQSRCRFQRLSASIIWNRKNHNFGSDRARTLVLPFWDT